MKYMLLIHAPDVEPGVLDESAAAAQIAPWNAYTQWLIDRGIYVAGDQLAPTSTATSVRVRDGQRMVTDGPFAETKEVLGGYYLIDCEELDTALEAAARCPGALIGTIEVRPLLEMAAPMVSRARAG